MHTLVINSGSSSLKFKLFDQKDFKVLCHGIFEEIGGQNSQYTYEVNDGEKNIKANITDHTQALKTLIGLLTETDKISTVAHRVVHGGEKFSKAIEISNEVLDSIKECIPLAPLHNPANIAGIEAAKEAFPKAKQVAVFDTAFFQQMTKENFLYPLPIDLYENHNIRKYGFHGTSHSYVCKATASHLGLAQEHMNFISIHLGNGCSMSLVKDGVCLDTTLGMTPLEGLMMGTRCGNIDPAIAVHLQLELGKTPQEVDKIFNKESGLKGISGTSDMREVQEKAIAGDENSQLALRMYAKRIKETIAKYLAYLPQCSGLIFTAGIGENSSMMRELSLSGLEHFGIELDSSQNNKREKGIREIHKDGSKIKIFITPTNEELEIAALANQL